MASRWSRWGQEGQGNVTDRELTVPERLAALEVRVEHLNELLTEILERLRGQPQSVASDFFSADVDGRAESRGASVDSLSS